ncbi:hypothetical protein AJ80_05635 [Polytolypa hystricis UAMH7299]|uniref:Altered inheritance of mitochondria protein 9, mitochondrial n=1 Tax=Polytolypa hystricis (strain UAMH7299) TaxID=1447883 RepID=A0A2B7Y360_POLH7|nr:hypothetical protein AJ80_05635 [Polytolypa hystricis UAMH7299]
MGEGILFRIEGRVGSTTFDYALASVRRERECISQLPPFRRPQGIFGGPRRYEPTTEAKLAVLDDFEKVALYLLPKDSSVHVPVLWNGDLHHENIFVDPDNPTKILSIIDWQTVNLAPLFQQVRVPGFLDYAGPRPADGFALPSPPESFEILDRAEKEQAKELQVQQTMYKTYEMLTTRENRPAFNALRHSKTLGSEIISLISQVHNDGERIIKGQLTQAAREWEQLVGQNGPPCPLAKLLTPASIAAQEVDQQKWGGGVQMLEDVIEALGGAENGWDGWVSHEDYEQLKQKLQIVKDQFWDHVAGDNMAGRKAWENVWPFQDD